jgi:hypothetical protein
MWQRSKALLGLPEARRLENFSDAAFSKKILDLTANTGVQTR